MRILLSLVFASAVLVSCSSVQRASSAKTMDIYGPGVIHLPVVADLVVNENKTTGTKVGNTSQSINQLKAEAVNAALKPLNGDVLVEPNFQIETVGSRVTVTVTGRVAFYKNFRQMQELDTNLLKTILRQRPTIIEPGEEKKKRKFTPMVTGTAPAPILTSGNILIAGVY